MAANRQSGALELVCAAGVAAFLACLLLAGRSQPAGPCAPATVRVLAIQGEHSLFQGIGDVARDGRRWLMVYNRADAPASLADGIAWHTAFAESFDTGTTWRHIGPILPTPAGYYGRYAECLVRYRNRWLLYENLSRQGADLKTAARHPEGWAVALSESADLVTWSKPHVIVRGQDYPMRHPLTNPSVVHDGSVWWMSISECLGWGKYRLRMMRATGPEGPWEDCGVTVDVGPGGGPQWHSEGAWDSTLFRCGGRWWIVFAGKQLPGPAHLDNLGWAVAERPTGPWRTLSEPFYRDPDSGDHRELEGRTGVVLDRDGTAATIVFDRARTRPWRSELCIIRVPVPVLEGR